MATNFRQPGDTLDFVAPSGGVVSGTPLLIGTLLVIPKVTAAEGELFAGQITGVWTVTKVSAQAWTAGAKVYWDNSAKNFTTTSSGNSLAGAAVVAAANPSATGIVRLNGITI